MTDFGDDSNLIYTNSDSLDDNDLDTFKDVGLSHISVTMLDYIDIVLIFLIIFTFTIFFYKFRFNKIFSPPKRTVLVLGPCDAGKTTLSIQLITGKFLASVTSMTPITNEIKLGEKNFNLIDFPGHSKLFYQLDNFINTANYILLVMDCTKKESAVAAAALVSKIMPNYDFKNAKLLCVCNKNDQIISRPMESVRKDFIQHLNTLSLQYDNKVLFKEWCSISSKKGEIQPVLDFLSK